MTDDMKHYIPVLTVAGSDSSGGAGIQADIKTISAIGCYAMSAITAITAQNTCGVTAIQGIDPKVVSAQLSAVCSDIPPLAAKTGMLFSRDIVMSVADSFEQFRIPHLVIDPVMVSTSGSRLMTDDALEAIVERLFPLAELVTPNQAEAVALTGVTDPMEQAKKFIEMGCRNVLFKGGDTDRSDMKIDYLYLYGEDDLITLTADAVNTTNTHGTGCTLSAAIASYLSLGMDLTDAVMRGKLFVTRALQSGAKVRTGHGHGPVNHLFNPRHSKYMTSYEDKNK